MRMGGNSTINKKFENKPFYWKITFLCIRCLKHKYLKQILENNEKTLLLAIPYFIQLYKQILLFCLAKKYDSKDQMLNFIQ